METKKRETLRLYEEQAQKNQPWKEQNEKRTERQNKNQNGKSLIRWHGMRVFLVMLLAALFITGLAGCSRLTGREENDTGSGEESSEQTQISTETPAETPTEPASTTEPESQTEPPSTSEGDVTEPEYQPERIHKIVLATDLHYLAAELSDGGEKFHEQAQLSEGQMVPYVWEILDAFIEDVLDQDPDLLILSGDLSLNGEKVSHLELAKRLQEIENEGIPILVIPGNHDINNPQAKGFSGAESYSVEWTSPEDFREIYGEFGYDEAFSEEEDTLSYLYELDESTWVMMLDSCQYETVCQVGGMIHDSTYDWMEPYLEQAWEEDIRILPVSHHNLLEQSKVSDLFVDDCTLEHDEKFIEMLEENLVPLYLSGHLHVQHFAQSEGGITEVVTSSLSVPPFQYAVIEMFDNGDANYYTQAVDVQGWALRHQVADRNLRNFEEYAAKFFESVSYDEAYRSLRETEATPKQKNEMAKLFAKLNPSYYAGNSFRLKESLVRDPAWELWSEYGFFSEYYDTMVNILDDEVDDYNKLYIEY